MGASINMGTTINIIIGSFDSSMVNTLYGDQILDKHRHAYTCWEDIFESYLIKI